MGVEVEIFGQKFIIKSDEEQAYILKLAEYVDSKMHEVNEKLQLSTPRKVAVLTALNITHELFSMKREMQEKEMDIANRADRLLELISVEFKT
jgi:cell division protein ZapA